MQLTLPLDSVEFKVEARSYKRCLVSADKEVRLEVGVLKAEARRIMLGWEGQRKEG